MFSADGAHRNLNLFERNAAMDHLPIGALIRCEICVLQHILLTTTGRPRQSKGPANVKLRTKALLASAIAPTTDNGDGPQVSSGGHRSVGREDRQTLWLNSREHDEALSR